MIKENPTESSYEKGWQNAAGSDSEKDLGKMSLEEFKYYESL
jgi:hypothetical protein